MKRTANNSCRELVQNRTPFQGSNLFAEQRPGADAGSAGGVATADRYIVYSYGYHWPLFICTHDAALTGSTEPIWFENEERASVSTSKQRSQAHPLTGTVMLSCAAMKALAETGRVAQAIVMTAKR